VKSIPDLDESVNPFTRDGAVCKRCESLRWLVPFQLGPVFKNYADGKLIVVSEDGKLALLDANPDEYIQASSAHILQGRSWTSATLAGGNAAAVSIFLALGTVPLDAPLPNLLS